MNGRPRSTLLGGAVIVACPLLCIGLPLLAAAGLGAGLALAIGGAVLGGVALATLAVGAMLAVRRRRHRAACCDSSATAPCTVNSSRAAVSSSPVEVAKR